MLGRYNWSLGAEVARAHQRESPYLYGYDVQRVLALSPKVDLSRTRSWAELSSIITGLVQVRLGGRAQGQRLSHGSGCRW